MPENPGNDDQAPVRRKRRHPALLIDLLRRAATEEFKRSGYSMATTASIARQAGTTEAQLFRYFRSKIDLFRESVFDELDRHFAAFNERHLPTDGQPRDLHQLASSYIIELQHFLIEHHKLLFTLLVAQTYAPESSPGIDSIDSLQAYFRRGAALVMQVRGDEQPRIDPDLLVRISFGAVLANVLFKSWLFPDGLASQEQIEQATVAFLIDGIGADLPRASSGAVPRLPAIVDAGRRDDGVAPVQAQRPKR